MQSQFLELRDLFFLPEAFIQLHIATFYFLHASPETCYYSVFLQFADQVENEKLKEDDIRVCMCTFYNDFIILSTQEISR